MVGVPFGPPQIPRAACTHVLPMHLPRLCQRGVSCALTLIVRSGGRPTDSRSRCGAGVGAAPVAGFTPSACTRTPSVEQARTRPTRGVPCPTRNGLPGVETCSGAGGGHAPCMAYAPYGLPPPLPWAPPAQSPRRKTPPTPVCWTSSRSHCHRNPPPTTTCRCLAEDGG